jgi:hypothetical protein
MKEVIIFCPSQVRYEVDQSIVAELKSESDFIHQILFKRRCESGGPLLQLVEPQRFVITRVYLTHYCKAKTDFV